MVGKFPAFFVSAYSHKNTMKINGHTQNQGGEGVSRKDKEQGLNDSRRLTGWGV